MTESYYDELASHPDRARVVGWESRLLQALRYEAALSVVEPGDTVLDVGAGVGDLGAYLAARGPTHDYIGVDVLPAMVSRGLALAPGRDLRVLDALTDPLPPCDVAVAVGTMVDGRSLRSDAARLGRFRALAERLYASARRAIALVVIDQDALEARPALRAESALGGARPAEARWVAERLGAHLVQCTTSDTDTLIIMAKSPCAVHTSGPALAARVLAGPWGSRADAYGVVRLHLAVGELDRAAAALERAADGAERRLLLDAITARAGSRTRP